MTSVVAVWTGREVRALRDARRMSLREFARHLGVSDRMISKWEAGGAALQPRPVNQEALDSSLAACSPEEQARFALLLADAARQAPRATGSTSTPAAAGDAGLVSHPVDGKAMVRVDAGLFLCGPEDESVWLDTFYIDIYPTTNADYSRFVAATGHRAPPRWIERTYPDHLADHPVVFVTWHDARAYADWSHKLLPSGPQWEKAARGTSGHVYPWGNQTTPAKCNVRENGVGATTPVDRYGSGVSPYGVYDLCGNIWEWCETETEPGRHELKGSAFTSPFHRAAPSLFNDASATMSDDDTGFRCVALSRDSRGPVTADQ